MHTHTATGLPHNHTARSPNSKIHCTCTPLSHRIAMHTHRVTLLQDCHTATLQCTRIATPTVSHYCRIATSHCIWIAPGLPCTLRVSHCCRIATITSLHSAYAQSHNSKIHCICTLTVKHCCTLTLLQDCHTATLHCTRIATLTVSHCCRTLQSHITVHMHPCTLTLLQDCQTATLQCTMHNAQFTWVTPGLPCTLIVSHC